MEINVLIEDGIEPETGVDWIQHVIEKTLLLENVPGKTEISLVLTDQQTIRELNREYRGQDTPTDVLAFSLIEQRNEEEKEAFIGPPDGLLHLGEVMISYPQAVLQAGETVHSLKKEMAILIVHGVLHLLGYDHMEPESAHTMKGKEAHILTYLDEEKELT